MWRNVWWAGIETSIAEPQAEPCTARGRCDLRGVDEDQGGSPPWPSIIREDVRAARCWEPVRCDEIETT